MVKRLRHRPFTAVTRVRFPLESLMDYRGGIFIIDADVAQLAEQLICNQQVIGSSPIIGLASKEAKNRISRGGAVWKLVGLITRRS